MAFVVNGLEYDVIDTNKKEVQVHWPDIFGDGETFYYLDDRRNKVAFPTGMLRIPENVICPYDGTSYTVVAVDGSSKGTIERIVRQTDRRTKCGYREVWDVREANIKGLSYSNLEFSLPKSLRRIGYGAFEFCQLGKIEIPSSVKVIQHSAFKDCKNLKKVIIPSSVDLIEEWAFRNCDGLKEAIIYNNDGVITIENGAFPSETKITYKSGMLSKLLGK